MGWKCGPCTLPHGARHQCDSPVQPRGSTPLHLAAQHRHVDLARLLVEHGADAGTQDKDWSTPIAFGSVARTCGSHTPLHQTQRDVRTRAKGWLTQLLLARWIESVDLLRILFEHGANAAAQDDHGCIPLHCVSVARIVGVAHVLIGYNTDAVAQDKHGCTPLHWALMARSVDLARLLVEHGADAPAQDNCASTPLHLAVQQGSVDIARFLIGHGSQHARSTPRIRHRFLKAWQSISSSSSMTQT